MLATIDHRLLDSAMKDCGVQDLEAAVIRSLQELSLESAAPETSTDSGQEKTSPFSETGRWVDLFVKEMMSARSLDDASARASSVLQVFEKSIASGIAESVYREVTIQRNQQGKDEGELVMRVNGILKRAVVIQHQRQKEILRDNEKQKRELQELREMVLQYQEKVRALEVKNYALTMHLRQADHSNGRPITGSLDHRSDVF